MDVVPRESQVGDHEFTDRQSIDSESIADQPEDPYSPGQQTVLPLLLGALIALVTAVVPIATVVGGRSATLLVPMDSALTQVPDPLALEFGNSTDSSPSGGALQQKALVAQGLKNLGRITEAGGVDQGVESGFANGVEPLGKGFEHLRIGLESAGALEAEPGLSHLTLEGG